MIIIPNVEKEDSCLNCPVWSLCWDNEPTEDISKDRCPIVDLAVGAIKAEPKHGRWLVVKVMDDEADFGETDGAECSACGYTTINEYWAKTYYHYCPNCGARMDEPCSKSVRGGTDSRMAVHGFAEMDEVEE